MHGDGKGAVSDVPWVAVWIPAREGKRGMYSENPWHDASLFLKAVISNQIARFFPDVYVRLTAQTGRGREDTDPAGVASYYVDCVRDYREKLGCLTEAEFSGYLAGKTVLEYGPGDVLGVALLLYALGARRVDCVDRFPLSRLSRGNISIYHKVIDALSGEARDRALGAFRHHGDPASGLAEEKIRYRVDPNGLSHADEEYDLILSRAVLEHVNDLEGTLQDVYHALRKGGETVHLVDLKSHGLDRYREFDFLTWPDWAYRLMYSQKGFPNRWRVDHYKRIAEEQGFHIELLESTGYVDQNIIRELVSHMAPRFRGIPQDVLSWKGFWIRMKK